MEKTYIDKLAFIEIRDRKVLETRSYNKDKWYIPGGKREEFTKYSVMMELRQIEHSEYYA